jgi:hypothetical protein
MTDRKQVYYALPAAGGVDDVSLHAKTKRKKKKLLKLTGKKSGGTGTHGSSRTLQSLSLEGACVCSAGVCVCRGY